MNNSIRNIICIVTCVFIPTAIGSNLTALTVVSKMSIDSPWSSPCFDMSYSGIDVSDTRTLTVDQHIQNVNYIAVLQITETLYTNGGCQSDSIMLTNRFQLGLRQIASTAESPDTFDVDLSPITVNVTFESELAQLLYDQFCPESSGLGRDLNQPTDITEKGCGDFVTGSISCPVHYSRLRLTDRNELILSDIFVPLDPGIACSISERAVNCKDQPKFVPAKHSIQEQGPNRGSNASSAHPTTKQSDLELMGEFVGTETSGSISRSPNHSVLLIAWILGYLMLL